MSEQTQIELRGIYEAIQRSQATIEFNLDGTIITANDNFLDALGYTLDELAGKHHRIFCEPAYAASPAYTEFWKQLNRGEFDASEYKRLGKGGKEVWIQASYNPILDIDGRPFKVVKFATDVTAAKLKNAEFQGMVNAIGKAQAVIEFNLDGTIITANDNFLGAVDYQLDELVGQHHRIFCDREFARSDEYQNFWRDLNDGRHQTGRYKRLGRGDKEIWLQASYNPILDLNGAPFKVVKFATDITAQVAMEDEIKRRAAQEQHDAQILQEKVDRLLLVVHAAAQGDLTVDHEVDLSSDDAISRLDAGVLEMVRDLRNVVSAVVTAASLFTERAGVISSGASEVAADAQTLGATIEEMSATIKVDPIDNGHGEEQAHARRARRAAKIPDRKAVSFLVDDLEYALPMERILEIVPYSALAPCRLKFEKLSGLLNVRGELVPAVDLRDIMGGGPTTPTPEMRMVVVDLGEARCALLVDQIKAVLPFRSEALLRIPQLTQMDGLSSFDGVINVAPARDVLLINPGQLLKSRGVLHDLLSLARLNKGTEQEAQTRAEETLGPRIYLTFYLDELRATELLQVREILAFPSQLVSPPGNAHFLRGLFNLRGTLVPVIDLRAYYKMPPFEDPSKAKLLIASHGDGLYGLMIDRVENILKVELLSQMRVLSGGDDAHHKSVIVRDAAGSRSSLNTLDLEAFLRTNAAHVSTA